MDTVGADASICDPERCASYSSPGAHKKKTLKATSLPTQSLQALPSVSYERKLLCCEIVGFCVER